MSVDLNFGPAYSAPPGNSVNFTFQSASVSGSGAITLTADADGTGSHSAPSYTGSGAITLSLVVAGTGAQPFFGAGAIDMSLAVAGQGAHGEAGAGAITLDASLAGTALHPRYRLRGVVKDNGALVDRRVRAYKRSTGALVAQGDTVGGAFDLAVGYALDEFYVVPIDLANDAEDWRPPVANRVLSVLVVD